MPVLTTDELPNSCDALMFPIMPSYVGRQTKGTIFMCLLSEQTNLRALRDYSMFVSKISQKQGTSPKRRVTICLLTVFDVGCSSYFEQTSRPLIRVTVELNFKVAQNSFHAALSFWWIVIATLYHLLLQSWYRNTAQLLVSTLLSFP